MRNLSIVVRRSAVVAVLAGLTAVGGDLYGERVAAQSTDRDAVRLSAQEIEEIRQSAACRNLVQQVLRLQKELAGNGRITSFYDLRIIENPEIVDGRIGKYYSVVLKEAQKSERFQFPPGEYTMPGANVPFRRSLTAFVREVVGVIEGGVEYALYVRGGASATPFSRERQLKSDFAFTRIEYLSKAGSGKYAGEVPLNRGVPTSYTNSDLPFLRAAYLQHIINESYPLKRPIILESEVGASRDQNEQFAELLLFINW